MRDSSLRAALKPRDFSGLGKPSGGSSGGASPISQSAGEYVRVPLDQIAPDLDQPRRLDEPNFQPSAVNQIDLDDTSGDELADLGRSIVANGIVVPLIVLRTGDDSYQLVAGHRRWLAAQAARDWVAENPNGKDDLKPAAGWDFKTVPVIVRDFGDANRRLAAQLIENLARQGMTKVDVGRALTRLREESSLSYRALAALIGRSVGFVQDCLAAVNPEMVEVSRMFGDTEDWRTVQRANVLRKRDPATFERVRKRFAEAGGSLRHLLDEVEREQKGQSPALAADRGLEQSEADEEALADDQAEGPELSGDADTAVIGVTPDLDTDAEGAAVPGQKPIDEPLQWVDKADISDDAQSPSSYRYEDDAPIPTTGPAVKPHDSATRADNPDNSVFSVRVNLPRPDALRLIRALRGAAGLRDFPSVALFETLSESAILDELHKAIKAVPPE